MKSQKILDLDATSSLHHHFHPSSKPISLISWAKLPGAFIKINFDGSKSSSSSAGGFVIRSWDGRFLRAVTTNLGAVLVLVVEATAMRNGVRVAVQLGYQSIILEGDN